MKTNGYRLMLRLKNKEGLTLTELLISSFLISLVGIAIGVSLSFLLKENKMVIEKIELESALYESSYYIKMLLSQAVNINVGTNMNGSSGGMISPPTLFTNSNALNTTYILAKFERENGRASSAFQPTLIGFRSGDTLTAPGTLFISLGPSGGAGNANVDFKYPYVSYLAINNVEMSPSIGNNPPLPIGVTLDIRFRFFLETESSTRIRSYNSNPGYTPPKTVVSFRDIQQIVYVTFFNNVISNSGGVTEGSGVRIRPEQGLYFFAPILPKNR